MSLSKGNLNRSRPQKHQNRTAFKNNLHDTSKKTKTLNSLQVSGVCVRCKDIIEWKIKYKKYKPLTAPAKCVGCEEKAVKYAYHVLCSKCATEKQVCAKCHKPINESFNCEKTESINKDNEIEIQAQLKCLPERKRRTVLRYIKKLKNGDKNVSTTDVEKLLSDIEKLNMSGGSLDSSEDETFLDTESEHEEI